MHELEKFEDRSLNHTTRARAFLLNVSFLIMLLAKIMELAKNHFFLIFLCFELLNYWLSISLTEVQLDLF